MADVVARSTQPALGAIKLAWWRERLEQLDEGMVPAEPRLQAAAAELLPRGLAGRDLAELEDGWAGLLAERPNNVRMATHGSLLFKLGARLLGIEFHEQGLGMAGRMFARNDAARRGLLEASSETPDLRRAMIRAAERPLTGLTALALRDLRRGGPPFEPEGTPGRAWTLLRHRLNGRFPR